MEVTLYGTYLYNWVEANQPTPEGEVNAIIHDSTIYVCNKCKDVVVKVNICWK